MAQCGWFDVTVRTAGWLGLSALLAGWLELAVLSALLAGQDCRTAVEGLRLKDCDWEKKEGHEGRDDGARPTFRLETDSRRGRR